MNRPGKLTAALTSAALSLCFVLVYGFCNWFAANHAECRTWYYEWERIIPFVPVFIVPYMSIDLFFVAAPFLCSSKSELRTLTKRIIFAILVAAIFFLLMPLRLAVERPEPTGWTAPIFALLHGFDQPHNLFPSLHITLRTMLADIYARHTRGALRLASHVWFSLIGISTLLTYQHHMVDVAGGFVLAGFCFYLFQEKQMHSTFALNSRVGCYYLLGALLCSGISLAAWPWTGVMLWPAAALGLVAWAYVVAGPKVFRKSDGRILLSARLIFALYLLGQWLSIRYYRRHCAAWNEVTPRVWMGAKLNQREAVEIRARGVTAVLDLTAEFSEQAQLRELRYLNIPVLDLTSPTLTQLQQAVEFITDQSRHGIVFIHCKIGYSRSAAVVGAYLITSGEVDSVEEAVARLRRARPGIVIRPEVRVALGAFHQSLTEQQ